MQNEFNSLRHIDEHQNTQGSSSSGPAVRKVRPLKRKGATETSSKPQLTRHAGTTVGSDDDSQPPEIIRVGPPRKKRKLNVQSSPQKAPPEIVRPQLKTYSKNQRSRRAPASPVVESEDEQSIEETSPIGMLTANLLR